MKTRTFCMAFAVFYLVMGISIFGYSSSVSTEVIGGTSTIDSYFSMTVSVLSVLSFVNMVASFLFFLLTLHFFRNEFF